MQYFRGLRAFGGIHVGMSFNTICNLKCPYCMSHREPVMVSTHPLPVFLRVIDDVMRYHGKVRFMILGGEPTLYPHLGRIIDHMTSYGNCDLIELYTNGTHQIKVDSAKLVVIFSCHPVALDHAGLTEAFITNVNQYRGHKIVQASMLQTGRNMALLDQIIPKLDPCEIVPNYIHHHDATEAHRFDHPLDAVVLYEHNGSLVDYIKARKNFKDWSCMQAGFTIERNLDVTCGCAGLIGNLGTNRSLFADLEVPVIKCQHDVCHGSCLMELPKYAAKD